MSAPTQDTLAPGDPPKVWRLKDNSPVRYESMCVYHDRNVELKGYASERSKPDNYRTSDGRCTTTPRFVVEYPDGTKFTLCYKHVPRTLKDNNMCGTYTGGGYGDSR